MKFDRILQVEVVPLSPEEIAEIDEQERQMQQLMDTCYKKEAHPDVDDDGCLECGYGAK